MGPRPFEDQMRAKEKFSAVFFLSLPSTLHSFFFPDLHGYYMLL